MTRDVSARLERLERLQPSVSDVQRAAALENVPRHVLQRIAQKRILSCAFQCMTPTERETYTRTPNDTDTRSIMASALVGLAERALDAEPVAEPDDAMPDDDDAAAIMELALIRLSEHFLDIDAPDDDVAFLGWFFAWDTRRNWTPPQ